MGFRKGGSIRKLSPSDRTRHVAFVMVIVVVIASVLLLFRWWRQLVKSSVPAEDTYYNKKKSHMVIGSLHNDNTIYH